MKMRFPVKRTKNSPITGDPFNAQEEDVAKVVAHLTHHSMVRTID